MQLTSESLKSTNSRLCSRGSARRCINTIHLRGFSVHLSRNLFKILSLSMTPHSNHNIENLTTIFGNLLNKNKKDSKERKTTARIIIPLS